MLSYGYAFEQATHARHPPEYLPSVRLDVKTMNSTSSSR
jgi:hypothetical protein